MFHILLHLQNQHGSRHFDLKEMVLGILSESGLSVSDDVVEAIVDKVFLKKKNSGQGGRFKRKWKNRPRRVERVGIQVSFTYKEHHFSTYTSCFLWKFSWSS